MKSKIRKKRRFLSDEDKKLICVLYEKGETCQVIGEKLNSDPSWITQIVKKMGVWKPKQERYKDVGRSMNDNQIEQMKQMHKSGKRYTEISKEIGRTLASIKNAAFRENLIGYTRKYEIDEDWLNEIDSPEKAVFLGLFFADGCNVSENSRCELFLQEKDKQYLDQLNSFFTNKPLTKRFSSKYSKNTKDQFGIQIFSQKWTDNLSRYGAVPNKTFLIRDVKNLPHKYEKYFIRGLFEGDGCLYRSKGGYFYFSLVGPMAFMIYCKDMILKRTGAKLNIYKSKQHLNDTFTLKTTNQADTKKVINWIYSDHLEIAMERKYKKAVEMINTFYGLILQDEA